MPSATVQSLTAILSLIATLPIDAITLDDDPVLEAALGELQLLAAERERDARAFAEALSAVTASLAALARDARQRHAGLRRALRTQSLRGCVDPATAHAERHGRVRAAVCAAIWRALRLAGRACLAPDENQRCALVAQAAAHVGEALYLTTLAAEGVA